MFDCPHVRTANPALQPAQYMTAHLQLAAVHPVKVLQFERMAKEPVEALAEVLDFLEVKDEHGNRQRRLECAAGLADHPLVHRPAANFTIRHAFASFPEHVCTLLRTIEQHDQVRE